MEKALPEQMSGGENDFESLMEESLTSTTSAKGRSPSPNSLTMKGIRRSTKATR